MALGDLQRRTGLRADRAGRLLSYGVVLCQRPQARARALRRTVSSRPMTAGRKSGIFGIAAKADSRHPRTMSGGTRTVSMVVYPDVQIVDATGPLEVFARTARWLVDQGRRREPAYTVELQ